MSTASPRGSSRSSRRSIRANLRIVKPAGAPPPVPEGSLGEEAATAGEDIPEGVRDVLDATEARTEVPAHAGSSDTSLFENLGLAQIVDVRDREVDVSIAGRVVTARRGAALHGAVLATAAR